MAHRDIVVIGASLGGVEALPQLVAAFAADLDAAVLIYSGVALAQVFGRSKHES